jgi:peptidylprolyl isomerase
MKGLISFVVLCTLLAFAGCGGSGSSSSEKTKPKMMTPVVTVPKRPPPKKLVIKEIKVGTGAPVKVGDEVTVNWAGVLYKSGKTYYSTWKERHPFTFLTNTGRVIPGFDRGVIGMKVGGRRELIIPPALAYENTGTAWVPPNETLIYVVDLLAVK